MSYPLVKLEAFLRLRSEFVVIDDFATYKRLRVQLHGRGIVVRDLVAGIDIKTKKQQVVRSGDFLVAEIDAKVGGFGVVPPEGDGAIVSSHYFLFEIDESKCLPGWLEAYIRSGDLEDQVNARGSTNYAAIRARHVLEFEISLPNSIEQERVLKKIRRVELLKQLQSEALSEIETLLQSIMDRAFKGEL